MANQFDGYLLKANNGVVLDEYISADSYTTTPNQRLDKDSYRDGAGELHRTVLPDVSTTIEFSTLSGLTLDEKIAFLSAINSGLVNAAERKVRLTYWNDESNSYKTELFYMPDIKFPIRQITAETILFSSISLKFVGYGTDGGF